AVVDEDTHQPAPNRLVHQRCRDRRVDAAGERTDCFSLLAYGLANLPDALIDEVLRGPLGTRAAYIRDKVAKYVDSALGVVDLGVKLHCPDAPCAVFHGGQCIAAAAHNLEARRKFLRLIAMRHPDVE